MNNARRLTQRELRKRMLRIEAESYRLEMASVVHELRHPTLPLQHAPMLLSLMGNKSAMLASVASLVAGKRVGWLLKAIPLALAGWRVARLVQGMIRKRSSSRALD